MSRFENLISRAFSMRRKTLRNALRGLISADSMAAAGIDPGLRPEALGLGEFAALANLPPEDQSARNHDRADGIS